MGEKTGILTVVSALILGAAIILSAVLLRSSVDRATEEIAGVRAALGSLSSDLRASARPAPRPARAERPDPNQRYQIDTAGSPAKGPESAPVTIVEFSDFQCPHCRTFHMEIFPTLQSFYGDNVRWVFVNKFFADGHQYAEKAAIGGECAARQGKFWEYADFVFAHQEELGDGLVDRAASEVGLDTASYAQCLDGRETASEVAADQAEAARVGVDGTPYFFVNGQMVRGAQPVGVFNQILEPYFNP